MRRHVQLLVILRFAVHVGACQPTKCSSTTCYVLPPSPPMYQPAPSYPMAPPMYAMAPSIMPLPPPPPPPPPPAPIPIHIPMHIPMHMPMHIPMPSPHHSSMMVASQTPFVDALDPPLLSVSSSATKYEMTAPRQETRWDRQEPEYKHVDGTEVAAEAEVAADSIVADLVDEKSTNVDKIEKGSVEKVDEMERLARMDLMFEEPEPTPFDNGTVTFHAWFFR